MMDWDVDMDDQAGDVFGSGAVTEEPDVDDALEPERPTTTHEDPDRTTLAPTKVHIHGLDTLSTDDVRAFAKEHYGFPDRVEWIDDQSANILFPSEAAAQDALQALSAVAIADVNSLPVGETVAAKPFSEKPEVALQVRLAVVSDRKARGAAARSRYYLFHPEQDPEERRRQRERRYRDRDDGDRRDRRRRRSADDDEVEVYDAGMYDDDEAALADRASKSRETRRYRSRSRHARDGEKRHNLNQDKELFPTRARNRSASPLCKRDGDTPMGAEEQTRAGTSSNRLAASELRDRLHKGNSSKELFPVKPAAGGHMDRLDVAEEATRMMKRTLSVKEDDGAGGSFNIRGAADRVPQQTGFAIKGAANTKVTELFPAKFGHNAGKELFSVGMEGRARQRKKAEDLFH